MKRLSRVLNVAVLLIIVLATSCKSGLNAYKKGDYYRATLEAVDRLRSDPNNKKAAFALENAYPLAQSSAMRQIDAAMKRTDIRKYEIVLEQYSNLNTMADAIFRSPRALQIIPNAQTYHEEYNQVANLLAEVRYNEGVMALAGGSLENGRVALDHFLAVNNLVPNYRDVQSKIEQARYMATLRVIVEHPINSSLQEFTADFFYNKLMETITRNTYRSLVRFYSPEEARSLKMTNPHQRLVIDFEQFNVGRVNDSSHTQDIVRENVVIGQTTVNGQKQDVLGTVKAKYTTFRREIIANGVLTIRFVDPRTGGVLEQRKFPSTHTWWAEWASFNGDERALTKEQIERANRKQVPPPGIQQMFFEFANPLYAQVSSYLSARYS